LHALSYARVGQATVPRRWQEKH